MLKAPRRARVLGSLLPIALLMFYMRGFSFPVIDKDSIIVRDSTTSESTHSSQHEAIQEYISQPNKEVHDPPKNNIAAASNRIVYVGNFGLGHRLSKMAAAYHLAQRLKVVLEAQWGLCAADETTLGAGIPIFDYLFGGNILVPIQDASFSMTPLYRDNNPQLPVQKRLWIKNDCHGYYAGQNFKNARQPIPESYTHDHNPGFDVQNQSYNVSPFFDKMDSDGRLFQELQDRFLETQKGRQQQQSNNHTVTVQDFMHQHRFSEHTVIGLHVRAGNGEQAHFIEANRGVDNHDDFMDNLVALLQRFLERRSNHITKPPLIFLATDTPSVIPFIRRETQAWNVPVPVVTFPQPQLPPSTGVTFSQMKKGQTCLDAWEAMMSDTILLGHTDVLVAAMRSSFTQIMPMSMIFQRHGKAGGEPFLSPVPTTLTPRFCELSESGRSMTCVDNREAWLFRDETKEWILSLDNTDTEYQNGNGGLTRVVHKVMVHFPDVDRDDTHLIADLDTAQSYFSTGSSELQHIFDSSKTNMTWGDGKTINQKYRKRSQGFTSKWTILPASE